MKLNKKNYGTIVLMLLVAGLLAACYGGKTNPGAASTPTGSTLTISGPIGNLTLLNHATSYIPNTATAFYNNWVGIGFTTPAFMFLQYIVGTTSSEIVISGTSDNGTSFGVGVSPGIICTVSGAPISFPSCSTWGILVNKGAGTINFTATPVYATGLTGTMSGSLTFPPF